MAEGPWLTVAGYKAWARIAETDSLDDDAISASVAAATVAIEIRALRAFTLVDVDGADLPVPADVVEAGYLLTNRLMSRRNSPDGVVGVSDMGTATIVAKDADIAGLLGPWLATVLA